MKDEVVRDNMVKEEYDLIVIGAGVTGLAAAMYAARLELRTLCLGSSSGSEFPVGGVITTTNIVENYPGFIKLTGEELADKIKATMSFVVVFPLEPVMAINGIGNFLR